MLITGIGAAGVGEQILKALNKSKLELFVIGTDITEVCFNKSKVDEFILLPSVSNEKEYEVHVDNLIEKYKIDIIFPGSEPELKFFSKCRNKYGEKLISINSPEIIDLCLNKYNTYEKLRELGIEVPKYKRITSIEYCEEVDYYPVILKPNTNSGGSSHIYVAFNNDEVVMFSKYLLNHGIDVIAQEYVGNAESEYTIGVSSDENGNVYGSIILKRSLSNGLSVNKKIQSSNQNITISSGISQGKFIHDECIKSQAELIAKKLKSKGPMNIQGRLVDGKLLIFEINPRLSGTTFLRTLVGYNEPENMINLYLNKDVNCNYTDNLVLRSIQEQVY